MKLKEIRKSLGVPQVAISKYLGIARPTYSLWENEVEAIPIKRLNDICNYFNVSIDYALDLSDEKRYKKSNQNIDIYKSKVRLKDIRKEHKHTQEYIANKFSINRSLISKYEQGNTIISTTFLTEYAKLYNISCDYLLGKIDEKKSLNLNN